MLYVSPIAAQTHTYKTPKHLLGMISTFHSSLFTLHFQNPLHLMRHKWAFFTFKDNTP